MAGPNWFAHLQMHSDQRRERQNSEQRLSRAARAQILRRDRHRCRRCGSPTRLEVHHVDGNWRNNDPRNLLTLCEDCHDALG